MLVCVQDRHHGDPVLGVNRPPLLPGPGHHGRGLQVSAAGAAPGLLLDQRELRRPQRHRLRLHTHQLPGGHDQHCEFHHAWFVTVSRSSAVTSTCV